MKRINWKLLLKLLFIPILIVGFYHNLKFGFGRDNWLKVIILAVLMLFWAWMLLKKNK
jgi:uncharacterized membrane protein